ncbi:MAG: hypothetical protein AAFX05_15325, partial [Planctomycetota bacterium]
MPLGQRRAQRGDGVTDPYLMTGNDVGVALFHKSKSLFGLRQGVRAMQGERTAIVTEGYTDVISC